MQVQLIRPCEGWYELNTDDASFGNPGKAGRGGLVRDHRGAWLKGSSHCIGNTTSVMAEFWALRDDLQLASQMGFHA